MLNNYEIEKEFREDCRDKKITAHSARKRVGLRRGCTFTHRTPCEQRALNGPCITYNLNVPMDWDSFQTLPKHIQNQYLSSLVSRFGATKEMAAAMLEVEEAQLEDFWPVFFNKADKEPDLSGWTEFLATPKDAPQKTEADVQAEEGKKLTAALRVFREERSLSTSALAEALDVTPQTVRAYERGARSVASTMAFVKKVSEYGHTSVAAMLEAAEKQRLSSEELSQNGDTRRKLAELMNAICTHGGMTNAQLCDALSCGIATISRARNGKASAKFSKELFEKVLKFVQANPTLQKQLNRLPAPDSQALMGTCVEDEALGTVTDKSEDIVPESAPAMQNSGFKLMGSPTTVLLALQTLMANVPEHAEVSIQVVADVELVLPNLDLKV